MHLSALSNHLIGNSRGSHELPQPLTAKPDLWDYATSLMPNQGHQKCDLGILGEFCGLTEVMTYPVCATLLWRAVVLVSPIQGLIDTGWQVTWLTHKQLKHTNSGCPREPWTHADKQRTLPCMVVIPLLRRHWGSQDRESVASLTKVYWTNQPESEPKRTPGLMHASFYTCLFIYISSMTVTSCDDVMIICFII